MLELVEAAQALADLMCDILEAKKRTNKAGTFYYEDVTLKSWILGPGGRSGNCEDCIENADAGEIEESEFFPADSQYGPVDEPPAHDRCTCSIEYRDTRRRVYV